MPNPFLSPYIINANEILTVYLSKTYTPADAASTEATHSSAVALK